MSGDQPILDVRLALSVGVPALVAVAGWFLAHWLNARREVDNKRREIRLRGLEAAYTRLATASQRDWTDEHKRDFEAFVAEIHLYGTPKQIALAIEIVKAFIDRKPRVSFDPLLEDLRNSLRQELRMEAVTGPVWWYRFSLPEWARQKESERPGGSGNATEKPPASGGAEA